MPGLDVIADLMRGGAQAPPPATPGAAMFAHAPRDYREQQTPYVVLVESGYQTQSFIPVDDVLWEEIHWGIDGKDTTARFTIVDSTGQQLLAVNPIPGGAAGLLQRLDRFRSDRRVIVQRLALPPDDIVLFDGYPDETSLGWGHGAQRATFTAKAVAEAHAEEHPAAQVYGRHMRRDPARPWDFDSDDRVHTHWPCVFNAEGRPNRAKTPVSMHLFLAGDLELDVQVYPFAGDGDPTAEYWTLAQALCYLVHHHVQADMLLTVDEFWRDVGPLAAMPAVAANEATDFATRMRVQVKETPVEATNLRSAMVRLLMAHGFRSSIAMINHYAGAPSNSPTPVHWRHVLRIWHPEDTGRNRGPVHMGEQAVVSLPRDLPFADLAGRTPEVVAQSNPGEELGLTTDRRAAGRITVLGGREAHEVTLYLRPGWAPFTTQSSSQYPGVAIPTPNMVDGGALDDARREYWDAYLSVGQLPDAEEEEPDPAEIDLILHGQHPENWRVRDVLRKWVFPMDARYDARVASAPFARTGWPERMYQAIVDGEFHALAHPAPLGASLTTDLIGGGGARGWAAMPRRLHKLVGRLGKGDTHDIIVEANFWAWGWRRIDTVGAPKPLDEECGILLEHDNIGALVPAGFAAADEEFDDCFIFSYLRGVLQVRVTATIYGDRRGHVQSPWVPLSHQRPTSAVFDTGERFLMHHRNPTHSLVAQRWSAEPDPRYKQLANVTAMNDYATREAKRSAIETTGGTLAVFWIQPLAVGTQVDGIAGAPTFPSPSEMVGITYHRLPERTVLHLADHRSDPALAVE